MVEIRLLERDADPGVVRDLRRAWSEEDAGRALPDPGFAARFDAWWEAERPQRLTWIATGEDRAVGMVNVLEFQRMPTPMRPERVRPTAWGYLANCFVLAGHRDAGVGSALVAACTRHADGAGWARIVLSPSRRSVPFYARHGFVADQELMVRRGSGDRR